MEDQIVDCFRHGGGVPYSAYPRFQTLMAEDSGAVHDAALIDVILPVVPGLMDRLREGIDVADIGCGSGHAVNLMAQAYPASPVHDEARPDLVLSGIADSLRPGGLYLCVDDGISRRGRHGVGCLYGVNRRPVKCWPTPASRRWK